MHTFSRSPLFTAVVIVWIISLFVLPSIPQTAAQAAPTSALGNTLQASVPNGQTITGSNQIRLYGPWRGKDSGTLVEGYADIEGGTGSQTVRLVVYALTARDGGYAPGSLVATSDSVSVPAGQSRRWVRFTFPSDSVVRNTRYALGVWFVGSGGARLWTEDRLGGRWDITASTSAPSSVSLSPDTARNEDLPGLYVTVRPPVLSGPAGSMIRLSPGEIPQSTIVTNPLAGPHRWHNQTYVPDMQELTAYERFTWRQIEGSTPGSYNWTPIRNAINAAKSRNQMFAFRVRARIESYEVPSYLTGQDFNDSYFRDRHEALHRAMKAEFDGDPNVIWIDLDGPGNYGEWAGGDWGSITQAAKDDVVNYLGDIWGNAQTLTVMFTARTTELATVRAAIPRVGFRNDIWGGEGAAAQMWSQQALRQRIDLLDSGEKGLLVNGEIDSAISRWNVRSLHQHILWFGPHSISNGNFKGHTGGFSSFSAADQAELRAAFGKLGYRFVVQHVDVPQSIPLNTPVDLTFYWQNRNVNVPVGKDVGTASVRLVNGSGQVVATYPLNVDVRSLLPTGVQPHQRTERITVSGIPAGTYTLQLRVVMPTGRTMNLANTGRTSDGAYPLGIVTVTNGTATPTNTATPTPTATATPVPMADPYLEQGGQVVMEAETYHSITPGSGSLSGHTWNTITAAGAGAGQAIQALPIDTTNTGSNTNGPRADYRFVANPGVYQVWVRGRTPSGSAQGAHDSVHIGLNGVPVTTSNGFGLSGWGPNAWTWHNLSGNQDTPTTITITQAGTYTLNVWMRESGVILDRVALLTSSVFIEGDTQVGPATSGRGTTP